MLDLRDVTFAYPGQSPVFERFCWQVARGDVWAVLGPSGCGKSTLLLLLAGLIHPQQGAVWIDAAPLARPRPRTGLVLQEYGLLPWATVRENVALGLRIRRFYGPDGRHAPRDARPARADTADCVAHWLARLNIADVADQYPARISGGQRQRAALARTLVLDPDLLLLDEPFSALDAPARADLQALTLRLCAEVGVTVVLVTHAIEEAAFVGQHILLLRRPPNTAAVIVPHPHPVTAGYREAPTYHSICATLRAQIDTAV